MASSEAFVKNYANKKGNESLFFSKNILGRLSEFALTLASRLLMKYSKKEEVSRVVAGEVGQTAPREKKEGEELYSEEK